MSLFSTIVLTEEDVHEAMPVGSDIESAVEFLSGLDEEAYYRTREEVLSSGFLDDEVGYWIGGASVKRAWWDFPIGRLIVSDGVKLTHPRRFKIDPPEAKLPLTHPRGRYQCNVDSGDYGGYSCFTQTGRFDS